MPQYKIKFNRWRGPENAVLSWGKTNEAIMEESLFVPTSPYGDLKREVLVVNVPFEFILREGSFLEVDINPSVLAQKTKTVIAT